MYQTYRVVSFKTADWVDKTNMDYYRMLEARHILVGLLATVNVASVSFLFITIETYFHNQPHEE